MVTPLIQIVVGEPIILSYYLCFLILYGLTSGVYIVPYPPPPGMILNHMARVFKRRRREKKEKGEGGKGKREKGRKKENNKIENSELNV